MRIKKRNKHSERYLPLDDIKKIDDEFLSEMENVKRRLSNVKDLDIIKVFQQVLLSAYNAAIEVKTLEREVDYEIKFAQIEARRQEIKPWRRGWWWRLIFQPLTNRAQDIIEERAELDADIRHTALENEIDNDRKKLPSEDEEKPSKRELKRQLKKQLKKALKNADEAPLNEVLEEPVTETSDNKPGAPADVPPVQGNENKSAKQLPGQIMLDDVQKLTQAQPGTRRPRPPRSCRKPPT